METKVCSKCKKVKPKSEFFKDSTKKNGLKSACKSCCMKSRDFTSNEYKQKRKKWINKDKEKIRNHKKVENITRSYTGKLIRRQYGITTEEINLIPQLHELKKLEIKQLRLCRKN